MSKEFARVAFVALLLSLSLSGMAAPQRGGMLGQSGGADGVFVTWCSCDWCTADADSNVYLPGGLWVKAGTVVPEKLAHPVDGALRFDGAAMFEWHRGDMTLYALKKISGGFERTGRSWRFPRWECVPAIAPARLAKGLAARAKVVALDPQASQVLGWTAAGEALGPLIDFSGERWAGQATGVTFDPDTGDVLICTRWEIRKVFRYGADGRLIGTARHGQTTTVFGVNLATERGRIWALSGGAHRLDARDETDGPQSFGDVANVVRDIAWGGKGYWLATTQGAQYYPQVDPQRCAKRLGGLPSVTALAVAEGRVMAVDGVRLLLFWLDDTADERLSSDGYLSFANRWEGRVTAIDTDGPRFVMHDEKSGENWVFDPTVTQWVFRDRKMFKTDRPVHAVATETRLGKGRAVAEADEIVIYSAAGKRLAAIPEKATALASEGRWLLAYVPDKSAILKYRIR